MNTAEHRRTLAMSVHAFVGGSLLAVSTCVAFGFGLYGLEEAPLPSMVLLLIGYLSVNAGVKGLDAHRRLRRIESILRAKGNP